MLKLTIRLPKSGTHGRKGQYAEHDGRDCIRCPWRLIRDIGDISGWCKSRFDKRERRNSGVRHFQ